LARSGEEIAGREQRWAFTDRRTGHGGDGSDHDPARAVLDLQPKPLV
jgi:hypothetical protein